MTSKKNSFEDYIEMKKSELVNDIKTNKKTIEEVAKLYGVTAFDVVRWKKSFEKGNQNVSNFK